MSTLTRTTSRLSTHVSSRISAMGQRLQGALPMGLAALGLMAVGMMPDVAVAAGKSALSAPSADLIYSGSYDLSYQVLSGSIEVCSSIRTYSYCAPVALEISMDSGEVTTESLIAAFEDYKAAIHSLKLPDAVLTQIDQGVETCLLPALADELNAGLVALPVLLSMQQSRPAPTVFTATFVGGDGTSYYGMGELELDSGVYKLMPDYVQGQIDAESQSGIGQANVPVTVQETMEIPAPWGVEVLTITARGNLGASFEMDLQ